MYELIDYEQLDTGVFKKNYCLVDLRTEEEYMSETIPGAINLPLFTEEERAEIGTEYVQGDVMLAKGLGLRFVGKKIEEMYYTLHGLVSDFDALILFCARGGYRSSAPVALFKSLGLPLYKLSGGYKKYRQYINSKLPEVLNSLDPITLYGHTGSGKTALLKELQAKGYPIIDLEGLANHKGSLLGTIGEEPQPSQKMFESLLYEAVKSLPDKCVFLEGESRRIGKILLPNAVMDALRRSKKILIESELDQRVKRIRDEYVKENDDELKAAVSLLERYISPDRVEDYKTRIDLQDYDPVIEDLILKYYDLNYATKNKTIDYLINGDSPDAVRLLSELYDKLRFGA